MAGQLFSYRPGHRPPATSTSPFGKRVAVCQARGWSMLPVGLHAPVRGSYSSADANDLNDLSSFESMPPATRTFPSGSSVAVWSLRATLMLPVERHLPTAGPPRVRRPGGTAGGAGGGPAPPARGGGPAAAA